MINTTRFSELANVKAWQRGSKKLQPLNFVEIEGKPSLLSAYASLFDPALEEVNGRYFLSNGFSRDILEAWRAKGVNDFEA